MKSIAVEGTTLDAEKLVKLSKSQPVLLTRRGQPVCAVIEIDELDVEAWSLGNNPQFIALLEKSRKRLREEGGIPLDEVRRRLGIPKRRGSGRVQRKARGTGRGVVSRR